MTDDEPAGLRIEARDVVCAYGETIAVDHVDLVAEPGRITALIGPNGAGKTTLFNAIAGAEIPRGGTIRLGDEDVTRLPSDVRTRLGLARTFQRSTVFGSLTVAENLRIGAENRHRDGTTRGLFGVRDRRSYDAAAVVEEVLVELGLSGLRRAQASTLPTGTLRLVELGRAMCTRPRALLLDEPASGLDDAETEELRKTLHRLAQRGLALLIVEHDVDLVRDSADVVYAMVAGEILASGPPSELLGQPDVRRLVLGIPS